MNVPGRIARFVRAARQLLWAQVALAALAVVVAIWAVVEVRGLVEERDQLRARVAELEAQQGQAAPAAPLALPPAPMPDYNSALPLDVPANGTAPDLNALNEPPPVLPEPAKPEDALPNQQAPADQPPRDQGPPSRWSCEGAAARLPRCQPQRPAEPRPDIPLDQLTPRGAPLGTPGNGTQPQPPRL